MDPFQKWNMEKSNFPHSVLSLSAQLSIWTLRGLGFCVELDQELKWDHYEERKDIITTQEFGGGKPPMLRIWLQMPPGPEGGVAGTIICHLQWASLICSHGVWLQPSVTVPLQIRPKKDSFGFNKVRNWEKCWLSWHFGFQLLYHWPWENWAKQTDLYPFFF